MDSCYKTLTINCLNFYKKTIYKNLNITNINLKFVNK